MRILHIGCGRKKFHPDALLAYVGLRLPPQPMSVVHLDADPALEPDLVCRLGEDRIPLEDDSIDLIIAWHVIEHVGRQGEAAAWFRFWEELYRVLAPNGFIYGESPYYSSLWAWSDPTHTRAISEHSFIFFGQEYYRIAPSAISPYRIATDLQWTALAGLPHGFLVVTDPKDARNQNIRFALAARKPLRPWWQDAPAPMVSAEVAR